MWNQQKQHSIHFNTYGPDLNKLSRKGGADSVWGTRNLRVQSNIKSWFDIDVLNTTGNSDKPYIKFKQPGKEINEDNFKYEQLLVKKIITMKKLYFEKKNAENKKSPKEIWQTCKSLTIFPKKWKRSKI